MPVVTSGQLCAANPYVCRLPHEVMMILLLSLDVPSVVHLYFQKIWAEMQFFWQFHSLEVNGSKTFRANELQAENVGWPRNPRGQRTHSYPHAEPSPEAKP